MNGLKATLVVVSVLFVLSLTYGYNAAPSSYVGTGANETPIRMVFLSDATNPPDLDHPADFTYELGSSGNTINWTFGDSSLPGDYRVDGNGTTLGLTSWTMNGTYSLDVDGLAVGVYNHTITVRDSLQNEVKDTVFVTVRDTTPPSWIQSPVDQVVEFGSSFRYDLNATDLSGIAGWWLNDTTNFDIDANGVITNKIAPSVGAYGLRVNATDGQGNVLSGIFTVTVQDTTPPTWTQIPVNQIVELGNSFRYDLNATDLSGITGWWVNDTTNFDIDANGVITNKLALAVNIYELRVNATDGQGNILSGIFSVTVQDTTPPTWTQALVNQIVEFGSSFRYDLNATDLSGISVWWVNDTTNFDIDASGVITSKTALSVGAYGLRVNATDGQGNVLSGTFRVTVQDTTPPTWTQTPVNQIVEFGSLFRYDLNATDFSAITWWLNNSINFDIDANGVITNKTFLPVGVYGLRVNATDSQGNVLGGTFSVTVQDTTPPSWAPAPTNQTVELGSSFRYDLNATDLSGVTNWWINDTSNFQIDTNGVITDFTSLALGTYPVRVNVTDGQGIVQSGTFAVTVQDTTSPTWDQAPVDKTIETGTPFGYDLNASDLSGISSWSVNDTGRFSVDSNGVITNVTSLAAGAYGIRVTVIDNELNSLTGYFKVTVQPAAPPDWVETPTDRTIEFGDSFRYDLNATDFSGIGGWWTNNTINFQIDSAGVITNRTALVVQVYGIRVNVSDTLGNTRTATFTVTVQDTTPPVWAPSPVNQIVEFGSSFRYDLNATDLSGISIWWVNDTTNFDIDANGVITNKVALIVKVYGLRVNATDGQGNVLTGTFTVTVQDTTPPVWAPAPVNQIVELGSAFRYDLNATDLSAITWWLNNTGNFNIDSTGVVTNKTGFSVGAYGLRVNATDSYGNVLTGTFTVTVQDTTPPVWAPAPVNQIVELGSSFRYDLNATDLSGISVWWVNDTTNFGIDTSGVVTNKVALIVKVYGLRVNATDGQGNVLTGTFAVTVQDTTPPVWAPAPVNQIVEFGAIFRYDLNATDLSGISVWWVNNTISFQIDTSGVVTNVIPLAVNTYGLRVNATDGHGNPISGTFSVTVRDTTAPVWDQLPEDQEIDFRALFRYDLNASDLSGIFSWWVNDTTNYQVDSNGVITNVTALAIRLYGLRVNVTDTQGNILSASFIVNSRDMTIPTWDQVPTDKTIEFGARFRYDLNASDVTGISSWAINDTVNFQIDGNGIITNSTPLAVGGYPLLVTVTNNVGNNITAVFTVTVQPSSPPSWVQTPVDQVIEFGSAFRYDLNATDFSGIGAWWVNDTTNFAIDGAGVITNIVTLTVKVYVLRVNVFDTLGYVQSATFTVDVQDTTAPTWDQMPVDHILEFGSSFRYDLNASDLSGITGWWTNDTVNFQIDMNGVVTNVGPLAVGVYGIRVNVTDDEDNTLSGVFEVTVQDTTSPTWDQVPTDRRVGLNQPFAYDLNATDLSGIANWVVNDTARFMFMGTGLLQNATLLPTGVYWIEVKACDPYNNNVSVVIGVMVDDGSVPTWDQIPSDQTLEFGAQFRLDANASDPSSISYYWVNDTARFSIYSNGTVVSIVSLPVGTYWLEVRAYDPYDLFVTATFSITVDDTTAPVWTQPVTDRYVEFGDSLTYDVNATDLSGIGSWWINDTTHFSIDVNGVITSVTALAVGSYGIMVNVTDTHANVMSASFTVDVQDSTAPSWVETPTGQTAELGTSFRYDMNATDLSAIADYWVNDTVHFAIDSEGILSNATTLALGVYWLQIRALDPYDNTLSVNISVTVIDTIHPVWLLTAADIEYVEGTTGHSLSWTVFDLNPGLAQVFRNGTYASISQWLSNSQVLTVNVDGLSVGVYNYTILVVDGAGNRLTDIVWVRVTAFTTTTLPHGNIVDFIMTMLTNVYVLSCIVLAAVIIAGARRRKRTGKTYEVRDYGPKFGAKK